MHDTETNFETQKGNFTDTQASTNRKGAVRQRETKHEPCVTINTDRPRTDETRGFKYTGLKKKTRHRWAGNKETHQAVRKGA